MHPPLKITQIASVSSKGFVGIDEVKRRQKEHLLKLEQFAKNGEWKHIRAHSEHPDSGFDWWMFLIDLSSSKGDAYKASKSDFEALKNDYEFMESYRKGVRLVLESWGWDVNEKVLKESAQQKWGNWSVRLAKMVYSLYLFDEKELFASADLYRKTKKIGPKDTNVFLQQELMAGSPQEISKDYARGLLESK